MSHPVLVYNTYVLVNWEVSVSIFPKKTTLSSRQACFMMNESVVFFYFQYVLVNWIYKSRVALLEQINVLRHQVFVALNSHKSSLFLCDLVIHFIDVRFLFQYAVGLGLRGCHSNHSSVYTGVSE